MGQLRHIGLPLATVELDRALLVSREAVLDGLDLCLDLLGRIELSLRRTNPFRSEPRFTDQRIIEKARGLDASTRHGLRQPDLIDWLAKIRHEPLAAHLEGLPCFQESGTARTVRAIETLEK